jgi:hypothetical protein
MTGREVPEDHQGGDAAPAAVTGAQVERHPRCIPGECSMGWEAFCAANGCRLVYARDVLRGYRARREQREKQDSTGK